MKKILAIVLAFAMIFTFAACGNKQEQPQTPSGNEGYKGEVMIYSSMAENVLIALQQRFQELYPNVKMDYYQAGSGKITTKLTTEIQAGSVEADIVWLADASEFVEYKNGGHLMAYESPFASTVPELFRDPDNMYIGGRAVLTGLCYAPDKVGDTIPTTWNDLLKPEYKGNILMTDAGASGSMKTWLYAIVNHPSYGWDFVKALKANGLELESGTTATHNKVATGDYTLGIGVEFVTKNLIADGSNIGWAEIGTDAIAYYSPIAIPAKCPNEENAKLLYDFIMNPEEGQKILVECNVTPVQPATPVIEGMHTAQWIADNAVAVDVTAMAAASEEMLAQYDAIFKQ